MKNLRLISCLILVGLTSPKLDAQPNPDRPFDLPGVEGMYGINIQIRNIDISGLILLNRLSDSSFRLVMTSELGPKLLDLELLSSGYKVNYAYPKLKRKRVLQSFYEDFSSLCCTTIWRKKPDIISGTDFNECRYDLGKRKKIIYSFTPGSKLCSQGRLEKNDKIIISFYYFRASDSARINKMQLDHKNVGMNFTLKKID